LDLFLTEKLVEVLSREEVAQREAAAPNERDKVIVRVLADGGLRVGELVSQERELREGSPGMS
jgi:integrase